MCTLFLSKGKSWRKWTKEHFLRYGYCDNDQLGGSYLAIMIVTIMGTVRAFCHDLYQHQDTETGP